MRIEITKELHLTEEESTLLDMHSFLNIMNVLHGELLMLCWQIQEERPDLDDPLPKSLGLCERIRSALADLEEVRLYGEDLASYEATMLEEVDEALRHVPDIAARPEVRQGVDNIASVFEVLKVRVREILARVDEPEAWRPHDPREMEEDLVRVLKAIEKNSKGRYQIVFNMTEHGERAYLVQLRIDSVGEDAVIMPPVLTDVLRDLVANARKYTDPGGIIRAELIDDGEHVRMVVADTGRGIPVDELEHVVEYGRRASNVDGQRTMGAGLGLTKAYLVTKQFQGRMWIESYLDGGTEIEITIPRPEASGAEEA